MYACDLAQNFLLPTFVHTHTQREKLTKCKFSNLIFLLALLPFDTLHWGKSVEYEQFQKVWRSTEGGYLIFKV